MRHNGERNNLETLAPAVPDAIDRLAGEFLRQTCEAGLRLATAESCTGGLLASTLTDVKGCSHAFDRGFVVYTDEAKHDLLGVPAQLIKMHSAVSEPVARAMAEGGLANSRADLCLAITGYADDADGQCPAGLVHFALASRRDDTRHLRAEFGDLGRGMVRVECLRSALAMIAEFTAEQPTSRSNPPRRVKARG